MTTQKPCRLGGPGDLCVVHKASTPTGDVVRLQQFVGDVPVFNSQVVVAVDGNQRVRQVDVDPQPELASDAIARVSDQVLSADQAREKALEAIGPIAPRGDIPEPQEVFFPSDTALRRASSCSIPPAIRRTTAGDRRRRQRRGPRPPRPDRARERPGAGFRSDPVASALNTTLRDPDASVAAGCGFAGTARATIDLQRVTRPLLDITLGADGKHRLEGPYVKMCEFTAPVTTFPAETNANGFNYSSGDARFECVQATGRSTPCSATCKRSGSRPPTTRRSRSTRTTRTTDRPSSRSIDGGYFSASGPCRPDRAEDAECIMHEYGHAIQNDQVPGWGVTNPTTGRDETRAMGEGFGDILACVFTASKNGGFGRGSSRTGCSRTLAGCGASTGPRRIRPTGPLRSTRTARSGPPRSGTSIARSAATSASAADQEAARRALFVSSIYSHHRLAANAACQTARRP